MKEGRAELKVLAAGAAVAGAALAAYAGSLSAPFVFLDLPAIVDNPTLRSLWPIGRVLDPPSAGGVTVGGRPVVNLSFALNYAAGGLRVWGYHALNLAIHAAAGLALLGIVRRTLLRLGAAPDRALGLGFAAALLWTLHPLQTEAVTYVVQRAESLMGLFYLLTLYCFIRYVGRPSASAGAAADGETGGRAWAWLSALCCLLGMATKEVMVTAPVIVLLYDWTFGSGSLGSTWRRRRVFYAALFSTWLPLAALVAGYGGNRGGTSGFGLGLPWWRYLLTQFPALVRYLRLAVWPTGLDFYYPVDWIHSAGAVLPAAVPILGAAAAALIGLGRRRWWGLAGFWFFSILAPTSLVPGLSQTIAEHRMYLALAPVVIVGVAGAFWALDRIFARVPGGPAGASGRRATAAGVGGCLVLAAALGWMTARRNRTYRSAEALWSDTAAKSLGNPYVQNNLGVVLAGEGRRPEAIGRFRLAIAEAPDYAEAHNNLGLALAGGGGYAGAVAQYREALRLRPAYAEAEANLGVALSALGRRAEALEDFRRAVRLAPDYAAGHDDLAVALAEAGRLKEAIREYRIVLRLAPDSADARYNLGNELAFAGRTSEAIAQYREAVRLKPDDVEARANLGAVLAQAGRPAEAVRQYERALDLAPGDPDIHYNLGLALRALGRTEEGDDEIATADRLRRARSGAK